MTPRRKSSVSMNTAGSPSPGEPAFLAVGKLRRPHGVHGEMIMDVLTDFPERLEPGAQLFAGQEHLPVRLMGRRPHGQALLVSFEGYDSPEKVGELRNQFIYVSASNLPALDEDEYYFHELIGLQVYTENGDLLGTLTEILETGANDVYIVQPENGPDILLPAIEDVIVDIDLEQGVMHVRLLPGLISGQTEE